jgi:hypothetical protein
MPIPVVLMRRFLTRFIALWEKGTADDLAVFMQAMLLKVTGKQRADVETESIPLSARSLVRVETEYGSPSRS